MSARAELNSYITALEERLRLRAILRGAAIVVAAALVTTLLLVLFVNHFFAFSDTSLLGARVILLAGLALAVSFGLAIPLYRLSRRSAVGRAEQAFPQFQQRLVTFAEREGEGRNPFIDLLAADTLNAARTAEPAQLVPNNYLLAVMGAGVGALAVLVWLIAAGPGYVGYGASLLWTGHHAGAVPFYDIRVAPGDITVRRNADQLVTAVPVGIQTDKVKLYARYQSGSQWEQVAMQPQQGASGFQFLFAGLPEGVEYYVEAGALHSRHFNIHVVDMPVVKNIHVTYRYPSWTGLHNSVEDHSGDLRAVEGTQADLEVSMDRPLHNGSLQLDDNQQVQLTGGTGNIYRGTITMAKDGVYHVAALDQGQPVRLSEDYFIAADKAKPPEVEIVRPGRDYRASPIEEVTVAVKASDEFGVNDLNLHYSVNGGPEQTANLLKQKGAKEADGSLLLSLENYKLVPGDVVSVYATAKDARTEARTDIFFIQADPFEREFSQSQQGGGGGGGGAGQSDQDISQREKEIIASTWKQRNDNTVSQQAATQSSKFLSSVQSTLADQARSLSYRMQSRELSGQNDEFTGFVKDMDAAVASMLPAADKLKQQKWNDALPDEQKALQNLLRAESIFRQIQVAFGSAGGGSGAGGAGRDLASLFDLELDTEKNQYETGETASPADQRAQNIDDALKKLDELARREEELAQQRNNGSQSFEQRWQQEMLRRDAEQLQRQLQQLAQNQSGASGSSAQGQGQAGSSQSSSGRSGQSANGSSDPRAQQALDRLREATDAMQRAGQQQSEADARRAADRLREAQNLLGGEQQQQASGKLGAMASEANRLSNEESAQQDQLRKIDGSGDGDSHSGNLPDRYEQESKLADDRQRLADDLARLQKQMRDAERELSSDQRGTSSKLRDALSDLDQNDLETKVQRSADWLRRGISPNENGTEGDIAAGLKHLDDQMRQAQEALNGNPNGTQQGNAETALDHLDELRSRIEALDPGTISRNGGGQQPGQQNGQQNGRGQAGSAGNQPNGGAASGDRGGYNQDQLGVGSRYGANYGGGYREGGTIYNNYDTGNNSNLPQPVRRDNSILPNDPEVVIQQGLNQLNQLRGSVQDDPEALRQVQDLIREMEHLDPRRFPGNPALVEQLHAQVLSDVDKLELQLRQKQDDKQSDQIRRNDTAPVPSGYQDAVAEYFRKLSKNP